jgi:hypothetical protein
MSTNSNTPSINKPALFGMSRSSTPATDSDSGSVTTSGVSWENNQVIEPHTGYKKVLVTGGAGFIGSHVAGFLLARGDDVVIVDDPINPVMCHTLVPM